MKRRNHRSVWRTYSCKSRYCRPSEQMSCCHCLTLELSRPNLKQWQSRLTPLLTRFHLCYDWYWPVLNLCKLMWHRFKICQLMPAIVSFCLVCQFLEKLSSVDNDHTMCMRVWSTSANSAAIGSIYSESINAFFAVAYILSDWAVSVYPYMCLQMKVFCHW